MIITIIKKTQLYSPFLKMGSTVSRLHSQYEEIVYFLPQSPQELRLLICLAFEKWKTESTLDSPSSFQPPSLRPLDLAS